MKKAILIGIVFFFLLFLAIGIFQSISQYNTWKTDPIGKYLIPPINPNYFKIIMYPFLSETRFSSEARGSYFYQYCFFHYFLSFFLALGAAIFWGIIFLIFQKRNYVDINETLLVIFGTILSGFPNFIIFLAFSFLIAIFFGLWQNYRKRVEKKVSLILPMIISLLITILAGNILAEIIGLSVLRI